MTKTYTFTTPHEMNDEIMRDIVADLVGCSNRELAKGNLINHAKIVRANKLLSEVITRNEQEQDFLESHHETF